VTDKMPTSTHLLTDNHYLRFLDDGYIVVEPGLSPELTTRLYSRAQEIYRQSDQLKSKTAHLELLGDNLRAQIPELDQLLSDPVVCGALTSILGPDYILHPHHFCHRSATDQSFHQDGNLPWNERGHFRPHRPDWAMLFFYPQAVDLANGPTEVVPGSQYWTRDWEKPDGTWHPNDPLDRSYRPSPDDDDEADRRISAAIDKLGIPDLERRFVQVPRGSAVVASYDLVHRGSRVKGECDERFMYKFYFARTRTPTRPAWQHTGTPTFDAVRPAIAPVVRAMWSWSIGPSMSAVGAAADPHSHDAEHPADDDTLHLSTGREDERVAAAYRLGGRANTDPQSLAALANAITDEAESTRRAATYGLRQAGGCATPALFNALRSTRPGPRRMAAWALGNLDTEATPDVLAALIDTLCNDTDDLARSNAAYGLGQVLRQTGNDLAHVIDTLLDRLKPSVERPNTSSALMVRSTVRESIAYALTLAAVNQTFSAEQIKRLIDSGFSGDARYVHGLIVEAIAHQTLPADCVARVLEFLAGKRYCMRPQIAEPV
jgi:hypothetical protein